MKKRSKIIALAASLVLATGVYLTNVHKFRQDFSEKKITQITQNQKLATEIDKDITRLENEQKSFEAQLKRLKERIELFEEVDSANRTTQELENILHDFKMLLKNIQIEKGWINTIRGDFGNDKKLRVYAMQIENLAALLSGLEAKTRTTMAQFIHESE